MRKNRPLEDYVQAHELFAVRQQVATISAVLNQFLEECNVNYKDIALLQQDTFFPDYFCGTYCWTVFYEQVANQPTRTISLNYIPQPLKILEWEAKDHSLEFAEKKREAWLRSNLELDLSRSLYSTSNGNFYVSNSFNYISKLFMEKVEHVIETRKELKTLS